MRDINRSVAFVPQTNQLKATTGYSSVRQRTTKRSANNPQTLLEAQVTATLGEGLESSFEWTIADGSLQQLEHR